MTKTFTITDHELGVPFADEGAWRSYHLTTEGDKPGELLENATIFEVDQDCDEIRAYHLDDASEAVQKRACQVMDGAIDKRFHELLESAHDYRVNQAIDERREARA
jgi:hypothetical protein